MYSILWLIYKKGPIATPPYRGGGNRTKCSNRSNRFRKDEDMEVGNTLHPTAINCLLWAKIGLMGLTRKKCIAN